jgi:hypothetical protein
VKHRWICSNQIATVNVRCDINRTSAARSSASRSTAAPTRLDRLLRNFFPPFRGERFRSRWSALQASKAAERDGVRILRDDALAKYCGSRSRRAASGARRSDVGRSRPLEQLLLETADKTPPPYNSHRRRVVRHFDEAPHT